MATGITERQRKFAELYVSGKAAGRAYEEAGYKARGDKADQAASRLLSTNEKVAEFVTQLKEQNSEDCRMSRKEAMDYLCDILQIPIGEISKKHVLAQEHQAATENSGEKIKMPGKMDAFKELAKMCGWYEPEKHKLEFEVNIGGDDDGEDE